MTSFAETILNSDYIRDVDNCGRRGASSQSRASFYSHMGDQNNVISHTLLIFFGISYGTKNVSFWWYKWYPWWNGPAPTDPTRHWRSLAGYISVSSKETISKFWHKVATSFKIVLSRFLLFFNQFLNYSVSHKVSFLIFFPKFWVLLRNY